ncbi:MAG: glycine zipper 2TM domain-containing protein [Pseudomonadota bacterium]
MKKLIATLLACVAMSGAFAQSKAKQLLCDNCAMVQSVKEEERKGKGGAVGVIGGAVIGGLLGNQVGGGTGKTVATVGGAAAGGLVGNEVQKRVTKKKVWVTTVKMRDGSVRNFEQEPQPGWSAGNIVRINNDQLSRY